MKKRRGDEKMLFEDDDGNIMLPEEVDMLSPWEIEEHNLHICDEEDDDEKWF
jgi:hypothetical protein